MGILATDNFTRANNADLGSNWSENPFESAPNGFDISSNAAVPSDVTSDCSEINNTVTWPADQYSECTHAATFNNLAARGCGVTCRESIAAATYYRLVGNADGWEVIRAVAGVFTTLGLATSPTFTSGDKMRLEVRTVRGNCEWVAKKNGVRFASGIDIAPIVSGSAGIGHSSTSTSGVGLSAWEGGDLVEISPRRMVITDDDEGRFNELDVRNWW